MLRIKNILLFFLLIFLLACSRHIYRTAYPTLSDGKYDSEFPYRSSSQELHKVIQSVKRLNCIAYYKSYVFPEGSQVRLQDINPGIIKKLAEKKIYFNNSVTGTATIVLVNGNQVAALTCAHVVDFPDTIVAYFLEDGNRPSEFVQSIAFKERQSNIIPELPERGELEILAMDPKSDLAILGKTFHTTIPPDIVPFSFPLGKAKELDWGNFVYMFGYPKGYPMITRGIVSDPDRDNRGSFLVDALFNRGFSGGIVLAIRDGVPNFELVGIANSVAADAEYVLTPGKNYNLSVYDPHIPFTDDIYVQFKKNINYGITFVIPTETIREFIRRNLPELERKGFDLSFLLKKPTGVPPGTTKSGK